MTTTPHTDPLADLRPIPETGGEHTSPQPPSSGPLAYDAYREGEDLVLEFDVPGAAPSDLVVEVEDRHLVVTVRRDAIHHKGLDVIERGRPHGVFTRRLLLGSGWDLERLTARAQRGVLSLRAPHIGQRVRRSIEIRDGDEAGWGEEPAAVGRPSGLVQRVA